MNFKKFPPCWFLTTSLVTEHGFWKKYVQLTLGSFAVPLSLSNFLSFVFICAFCQGYGSLFAK